jgi:ribosomal subunit interface protein
MRLEVRSENFDISQQLRDSIERRLQFLLGRFSSRIGRVAVHLEELRSPHRIMVTSCRIVVRFVRSGKVSVEDTDNDLEAVVNRSTHRVAQLVRRHVDRWHAQGEQRQATR